MLYTIGKYELLFILVNIHSDKQRLSGGEARRGVLLHQGQSAETKLMDWLIGVQRGEVCVHLTIILSNVKAVGIHVFTVEKKREEHSTELPSNDTSI